MASTSALLRAARAQAGITQAELARRAGLPRSAINAYERGAKDPAVGTLDRIVRAIGLELALAPTVRVLDDERARRILGGVLEIDET